MTAPKKKSSVVTRIRITTLKKVSGGTKTPTKTPTRAKPKPTPASVPAPPPVKDPKPLLDLLDAKRRSLRGYYIPSNEYLKCEECKAYLSERDKKAKRIDNRRLCAQCTAAIGKSVEMREFRCISCDSKLTAWEVEFMSEDEQGAPMCKPCNERDTQRLFHDIDTGIAETERWKDEE